MCFLFLNESRWKKPFELLAFWRILAFCLISFWLFFLFFLSLHDY